MSWSPQVDRFEGPMTGLQDGWERQLGPIAGID